jgi:hypothetical protein
MLWKSKHRSECYPGIEPKARPQERRGRLLLITLIAVLSVLSLIYVSRARADGIHQIDLAGLQEPAAAPRICVEELEMIEVIQRSIL